MVKSSQFGPDSVLVSPEVRQAAGQRENTTGRQIQGLFVSAIAVS